MCVGDTLERVGFDRIDVFTRQVEAAFAKHNAFNLSGEFNLTRHALTGDTEESLQGQGREGRTARARTLPPIIPFPGYSGHEPWRGPTNLADMIATDTPGLIFLHGPTSSCGNGRGAG